MFKKKNNLNEKTKKPFYKRKWFIGLVVLFALVAVFSEGDETEQPAGTENEPTYDYRIVEEEKTNMSSFERTSLRVVTDEKLNKEQIETLLKKIQKTIKYNENKDQVYIFLYDNENIADNVYSLGRLVFVDKKTEIDSREKDWDNQPSEREFKLYKSFMDKALELNLKDIYEDDDFVANELANEISEDAETILESVEKVIFWIFSDTEQ